MKTPEQWAARIQNSKEPWAKLVTEIQLDAVKEGARRAAKIVAQRNFPVISDDTKAIITAAETLTLEQLNDFMSEQIKIIQRNAVEHVKAQLAEAEQEIKDLTLRAMKAEALAVRWRECAKPAIDSIQCPQLCSQERAVTEFEKLTK